MDGFLDGIGDFHDGVLKEFHAISSSFIDHSLRMTCDLELNMRLLVQRQWGNPSAVELIAGSVSSFSMTGKPDVIYDSTGVVGYSRTDEQREISLNFLAVAELKCRRLLYRAASEWMGRESRFGEEIVLTPQAIRELGEGWVMCDQCGDTWQTRQRTILKCYRCSGQGR